MSVVVTTKLVETRVNTVQCDGPECNVAVEANRTRNDETPEDWYSVTLGHGWKTEPDKEYGPWHFHNAACLAAWGKLRREAEVAK